MAIRVCKHKTDRVLHLECFWVDKVEEERVGFIEARLGYVWAFSHQVPTQRGSLYRSPSLCGSRRYFHPRNKRVKFLKVGLGILPSIVMMPILGHPYCLPGEL